ncbi:MAG TPA: potassium-transporting ATPase subunit C, partial [Trinickia sp.]|nr:potassium-transporting ATPase subunit C [Trinickia sp.]
RLSATTPMPYNAQSSGGSNLGPTNPALADEIKGRIDALKAAGTDMSNPVPVDLVTSSASGLDPEISPAAAAYQAARVAKARGLTVDQVNRLIALYTAGRQFGILGEARVNVLKLNLALDDLKPMH